MKILIIAICILIITLCSECKKKEPEFFKRDAFTRVVQYDLNDGTTGGYISERYIISNPPSNPYELKDLVDDYCNKLPKPENEKYAINRWFYKETWNTPRDFVEGGRGNRLYDRIDDLILKWSWVSNEHWKSSTHYTFFENEELIKYIWIAIDHNDIKTEKGLATP